MHIDVDVDGHNIFTGGPLQWHKDFFEWVWINHWHIVLYANEINLDVSILPSWLVRMTYLLLLTIIVVVKGIVDAVDICLCVVNLSLLHRSCSLPNPTIKSDLCWLGSIETSSIVFSCKQITANLVTMLQRSSTGRCALKQECAKPFSISTAVKV